MSAQNLKPTNTGPTYDREGRIVLYQYADATRDSYAYDPQGRLTSFADRAGKLTHFSADTHLDGATISRSAAAPNAAIDATLFTTYDTDSNGTTIGWVVCGSTQQTTGCYGSGSLGPFGKVSGLIEGYPTTDQSTSTVTRYIYIVDVAAGVNHNAVTLYVYKKTDMITPDFDFVDVTLFNTVSLPLTGGTSASAFMAANKKLVLVATNQTSQTAEVQKSNLSVTTVSAFAINVSAITADQYGYFTISYGPVSGADGNAVLDPRGSIVQDGGGVEFMTGTQQAIDPSAFP